MDYVPTTTPLSYAFYEGPSWEPPAPRARTTPAVEPVEVEPVVRAPQAPEPSTPDLPKAVGWMIVGAYAAILGAFGLAFFGDADVGLVLGVCAVYLAVYLGVPAVILRMEPKAETRPDLADFLRDGLSTWTGRVSAGSALAQILTVPVALAVAAAGLGIIVRLSA
ncbi:hypothetical protein CFHF_01305 [Caulobacter flavus]|uniref:Uncharacterized protein n=1 Tax=Caulobacter flavus TaxID=1679497 RepID=A0A2N5D4X8_9CAUL|nr:hypothetical protein [Caulobacter flavus]AYV47143.1 hypothetical protein C1707_13215 [Caulobacter flavus]PLR21119.1 hypothetical protein CFHF_01305 [Caulobacter flavus]